MEIEVNEWLQTTLHWIINGEIKATKIIKLKNISVPPTSLLIVHYENVIENTRQELENILNFLKLEIDEERMKCVLKHSRGRFKRKHGKYSNNIFTLFNQSQRESISNIIKNLDRIIQKHGFEGIPRGTLQMPRIINF